MLLTTEKSKKNDVCDLSEIPCAGKEMTNIGIENKSGESFASKIGFEGKNLKQFSQKFLSWLAREKEISQGIFYIADRIDGRNILKFLSGFACTIPAENECTFEFGEGFPGQVAKDGKILNITDIPDGYMVIESGLGKSLPVSLIIFPVKHNNKVLAVVELASFHNFSDADEQYLKEISLEAGALFAKCSDND